MTSRDDARHERAELRTSTADARLRHGARAESGAVPTARKEPSQPLPVEMAVSGAFRAVHLADHPAALPILEASFIAEWPDWYGEGGPGDAAQDLREYAARDRLPVGLVGLCGNELVGFVVLKATSIASRPDLGPWAAAGLVLPPYRRRGFGAQLLRAAEKVAHKLGFEHLYCGTASAALHIERCGWGYVDLTDVDGTDVAIYKRTLRAADDC